MDAWVERLISSFPSTPWVCLLCRLHFPYRRIVLCPEHGYPVCPLCGGPHIQPADGRIIIIDTDVSLAEVEGITIQ